MMFIPEHFAQRRIEVLHELMRTRPLATLVTLSPQGLNANHVPLHLSQEPAPFGTLRGHVARENPIWQDFDADAEVLAVFHGPEAYITPSWYPSKKRTGKVVPTWNYAVVHAYGRMKVIEEAAWLRAQLEALTAQNEAAFAQPWHLDDAPPDYIARLTEAIVGLEIPITRLMGKWKTGQNQPKEDRAGVAQGLSASAGMTDAAAMAALMTEAGKGSA